jgi:hypothetical protein
VGRCWLGGPSLLGVFLLGAPAPAVAQARLEVGWISLEPRLPPPNSLDAPHGEGWPMEGDRVHWVAHVLNRGPETVAGVPYSWSIDDGTSQRGTVDLPPGETTLWLSWSWTFDRHRVSLALLPSAEVGDPSPGDDSLEVFSDALSVGLGVEQDIYDWLLENDGPGIERFMQQHIAAWNEMLAGAVHTATPDGVLDRIRLEEVQIHPAGRGPRFDDVSTDLRWFFRKEPTDPRYLNRGMQARYRNDQTIVLHEMLHLRGLIDLYAYAVTHDGVTGSRVEIAENGHPIVGTKLMPDLTPSSAAVTVYRLPADGLMGTRFFRGGNITEHSAFGLNRLAGRRTPQWFDENGNLISLGNVAWTEHYTNLIPERTDLRLLDQGGRRVANASVEIYLDQSQFTYQNVFGPVPDRVLRTGLDGVVSLPEDLLAELPTWSTAPAKAMVMILGVKTSGARGYPFLPVYDLNLLYFRGGGGPAEMELEVEMHTW